MMKKLLFIFTIFALWAPRSWALDATTWNNTIEQTAHFGFVCNNLLQAADERDIETLSEQQKKSVAIIRAQHAAALQTIIAAQKVENAQVKTDALKSFGNALLTMAQELGISGGIFGSLPQSLEGSDSSAHLSTVKSTVSAIESLCTTMFKKSLQERIART